MVDSAAHADPRTCRLEDGRNRIGYIYGGKAQISHAVSHKKAIHNCVYPG